jgi:FtsZ-interacting cell division protein YlmF
VEEEEEEEQKKKKQKKKKKKKKRKKKKKKKKKRRRRRRRRKKMMKKKGAPVRVPWYFCIIPRLRRWFATRKEAQLLRWHKEGRKKEIGKLRHPTDATQWGNINF